jgi:hypothetical protein
MIKTGYGRLFSLSRDQGQRWCGAASVKPHRTTLVTDRTAPVRADHRGDRKDSTRNLAAANEAPQSWMPEERPPGDTAMAGGAEEVTATGCDTARVLTLLTKDIAAAQDGDPDANDRDPKADKRDPGQDSDRLVQRRNEQRRGREDGCCDGR